MCVCVCVCVKCTHCVCEMYISPDEKGKNKCRFASISIFACVYLRVYICSPTYVLVNWKYIRTYIYTYMSMHNFLPAYWHCGQIHIYICIRICILIYKYTQTVVKHSSLHVYIYIYIYICMHIYVYTHAFFFTSICTLWPSAASGYSSAHTPMILTSLESLHHYDLYHTHNTPLRSLPHTQHTMAKHRVSPPDIELYSTPIMTTLWPLLPTHHTLYNYTHTRLRAPDKT